MSSPVRTAAVTGSLALAALAGSLGWVLAQPVPHAAATPAGPATPPTPATWLRAELARDAAELAATGQALAQVDAQLAREQVVAAHAATAGATWAGTAPLPQVAIAPAPAAPASTAPASTAPAVHGTTGASGRP